MIIVSTWSASSRYTGFVLVLSWALSSTFFYRLIGRDRRPERGSNLMALVSTYREFASTVVYRLEQGALGQTEKGSVMVCIDELDKIIDLDSLRDFLRRMKGIFEVPGVYYYLSLSEDALSTLYLGTAEGKNEVDSSLDHIVRIAPLSWEKSNELTLDYLQRRGYSDTDLLVSNILAASSFGLPRDILRRVDEFLAKDNPLEESPSKVISSIRREQIELSVESYNWPIDWYKRMSGDPEVAIANLDQTMKSLTANVETINVRGVRSLVLIWVLCTIEVSMQLQPSDRASLLEKLHDFGYQISLIPPNDLFTTIENIERSIYYSGD